MSHVDDLIKKIKKLEQEIKKDVPALKKKPSPALTKKIRDNMIAIKKLEGTFDACAKQDKAEVLSIMKSINPGL